jgi:hypothetical protein
VDFDSARLTSEEPKGLVPDGDNFTVVAIDGDYRRLIQHDTVVRTVNESIHSAQIYSEVIFEEHLDELHGDGSSSKYWQVPGKRVSFPGRQLVCLNENSITYRGMFFEVVED